MRDLFKKMFERRYSAVNVSDKDNPYGATVEENIQHLQQIGFNHRHRKSLQASRPLKHGLSIVDSFFNERKSGKRYPKCAFLLLAAGLCAITSAIAMYILDPYDTIFKWKLKFTEGGEIFKLWEDPPVNLYIKIYLWNITNSEEFLKGNEKMKVEEVGPYVYRELLKHDKIVFNDNGTVSTEPKHPLVWDEELSMGHKENDTFLLPNIALLSIAQVASEKNYFFRLPINLVIRQTNSQPIVKMTAKEFMFGYESPLTTLGNQFLPDWIYFDKVGLIDRMYDFTGDFETFYTGEADPSMSGLYDTYMGSKKLKQWPEDHCSNINGASDGTKFKSFIQPDEKLLFFRKSMCRPQRMIRVGNATVKSDLTAYKYKFEDNAMDNGAIDKRNKCFCREGNCLPSGLLDISECYYGFPIALSYPHFLDTDEKVVQQIEGVKPNRSEHETYFMVQPTSGLPLELSVKFQINMAMRDVSNMAHVEQFSNIVIPMVWFEITLYELPHSLRSRFKLYLNILPVAVDVTQWSLFVGGILSLLFAITRVSMQLSRKVGPSHKISKQRKYSSIYPDMIQRDFGLGTDKIYELNEKMQDTALGQAEQLLGDEHEINLESKYMLEDEPAISEDECSENGSKTSSDDMRSFKISENGSFQTNSTDVASEGWRMGPSSSCINDLNNDDFVQILHIDEPSEDESDEKTAEQYDNPTLGMDSNFLALPESMKPNTSEMSISYILDHANDNDFSEFQLMDSQGSRVRSSSLNVPEMKEAPSDYSISQILDQANNKHSFQAQDVISSNNLAKSTNSVVIPRAETRNSSSDYNISHIMERPRPRSNSQHVNMPMITVDSGSTTTTPQEIKSQISFFLDADNMSGSSDHNNFVNDSLRSTNSRIEEQKLLDTPRRMDLSSSDASISKILDQV